MSLYHWSAPRVIARGGILMALGISMMTGQVATADEPDLSPVLTEMVDGVVIPTYEQFAAVSANEVMAVEALCTGPSPETLRIARAGFASLVDGFSRIEAMRFGPARDENRFEKLFFWPDRRGRGLRQVQEIILEENTTALDADQLAGKSVAVQGLLALDFALSDEGAGEALLRADSFRCGYALSVARRIAATAQELLADWTGPGGYGNQMKNAGPNQAIYRTSGEAMQEILRSTSEVLTIDREFKIARVIGDSAKQARLKRAPFWRSGLWLQALDANVAFVENLFAGRTLAAMLDDENQTLPKELRFELEQARKAIADASVSIGRGRGSGEVGEDAYAKLKYALVPLHGAADILESRLPQALGLVIGFNSLDGD